MKAFLAGVIGAIGLALIAAYVLPGILREPAEQAYSTPSTRVTPEPANAPGGPGAGQPQPVQ